MTVVGLTPISLKSATLTIADDDFTAAVNEVAFTPEARWEQRQSFSGSFTPFWTATSWTVVIGYAQDTGEASLAGYLVAHMGARRSVVFTPRLGGPSWAADVLIFPGRLGGPTAELLTSTTVLPLDGEPRRV